MRAFSTMHRLWGRAWIVLALLLGVLFAAPAEAQDSRVIERLESFGRMDAASARRLATHISRQMEANAQQGGDRYDAVREQMGEALFGQSLTGQSRDEYNRRLGMVLGRLSLGLNEANLESQFRPRQDALLGCARAFGVRIPECEALMAAALRRQAPRPYASPDDGRALFQELERADLDRIQATEVVRALGATLLGVLDALGDSDRRQVLSAMLERCPGSLSSFEDRLSAWHHGPSVPMARCLGRAVGQAGAQAPQILERTFGMARSATVPFLRWAHLGLAPPRRATPPPRVAQAPPPRQAPPSPPPRQAPPPPPPQRQPPPRPAPAAPSRPPAGGAPQTADDLMRLAGRHYNSRNFTEAAHVYDQVTMLDPGSQPAWIGLGASRLEIGNAAGALMAVRRAAQLGPGNVYVHLLLGRALELSGSRDQAIGSYRQALAIDPRNGAARQALVRLHAAPGAPGSGAPPPTAPPPTAPPPTAPPPTASPPAAPPVAAPSAPAAGSGLPQTPSRDDIVRILSARTYRLQRCEITFHGTVSFRVVIEGATGLVREVGIDGELAGTEHAQCMEGELRDALFPRFEQEELEIHYPFQL